MGMNLRTNNIVTANNGGVKVYRALLTQIGTAAPTAVVLENNLGNIRFSYETVGVYRILLPTNFQINKVFVSGSPNGVVNSPLDIFFENSANVGIIRIGTISNFTSADDILLNQPVEILVYP